MKKSIAVLSIVVLSMITTGCIGGMYANVNKKEIGEKKVVDIKNRDRKKIGTAVLTQGATGVLLEVNVKGLPKGKHGMHFHQKAMCEGNKKFKTAKGHIAVQRKPSGFLNLDGGPHEGNLPNLIVSEQGTANVELYSEMVSFYGNAKQPALFDEDGSALMIHINEDDHMTQPIGGSGARIACATIEK